jgi:hypothetical protein
MEEQRKVKPRRRRLVAAIIGAVAVAIALPASGAFAGGGDAGSAPVQNEQVQNEQGHPGRDGDCPGERDGQGEGPESGSSIQL